MRITYAGLCMYVFVGVAAGPFTYGGYVLLYVLAHDEWELSLDNLQLEDAVTLDLQGGAAVFNVKCAHAAEPFTNERCSVIGFTYVVGARTHTRKDSQSSPSCWWNGYKQRTQVPRCLGSIFRSHRAAAGCRPVP